MANTMKRTRVAGGFLLTLYLGACDFTSPVNSNPNSVAVASVDQLFTGIQVNSYFLTEGQIARIATIWTQQMAGTDKQFVGLDDYTITEEAANDEFSTVYTGGGLIDIRTAIAQAEEAGRSVYAGILKVHEAYMIGMTASIFGDIPYSDAVTAGIDDPILDGQAAVYMAIQSLLDDAIGDLGKWGGQRARRRGPELRWRRRVVDGSGLYAQGSFSTFTGERRPVPAPTRLRSRRPRTGSKTFREHGRPFTLPIRMKIIFGSSFSGIASGTSRRATFWCL